MSIYFFNEGVKQVEVHSKIQDSSEHSKILKINFKSIKINILKLFVIEIYDCCNRAQFL